MTLAVAFLAGLVSCVSPCVLPVVPVYAGYVAGGAGGAGAGWSGSSLAVPAVPSASGATWRAIGFLLGFLGVFVLLWASIGVVGFALMSTVPLLRQATGAAIVVMGILMVAGRHPMLAIPARLGSVGGAGGPLVLGAVVAVGGDGSAHNALHLAHNFIFINCVGRLHNLGDFLPFGCVHNHKIIRGQVKIFAWAKMIEFGNGLKLNSNDNWHT